MSGVASDAALPAPAFELARLTWRLHRFEALDVRELAAIYTARQKVFALEQECAYLDADGFDESSLHLAAWSPGRREPVAYARLLEPGSKYADASIGRVITAIELRRRGLGREIVERAIVGTRAAWPHAAIRISAQTRLEPFYASFGFAAVGPSYLEDGIPHTEMLLAAEDPAVPVG